MGLSEIIQFVSSERSVCPLLQHWSALWESLPARARVGKGWNPPAPLILAAWGHTSDKQTRDRLVEHLRWSDKHDALDVAVNYLISLSPEQWHCEGE